MSQIFKYHVNGEAQVFDAAEAPDHSTGWYNSPVDAAAEKAKLEAEPVAKVDPPTIVVDETTKPSVKTKAK